ncbi:MAG: hypothetical protein A3I61_15890 [Acidobacteria bacterium RIFCSPLOWO2_02_FULL_68_18]|nr:MAG: hypothetical protein A3I61_15890 [Acidobacteria bacterium RIFCSPLOWO2_02_FULL_68_18]OFW51738.1 MAG: hypothetical protein A3G77_12735 [Acidobacteria bacterium RIFCSPLOWO2_12_FULL_68_19]
MPPTAKPVREIVGNIQEERHAFGSCIYEGHRAEVDGHVAGRQGEDAPGRLVLSGVRNVW